MEQETAECWIVQYRVKSRSSSTWGAWSAFRDYRTERAAKSLVDEKRETERHVTVSASMEWRVLHVTQEVVY